MKKFKITYKNLNICFGDNTFTEIFEGETAERALFMYGLDHGYNLKFISAEEISDDDYWNNDDYWYGDFVKEEMR